MGDVCVHVIGWRVHLVLCCYRLSHHPPHIYHHYTTHTYTTMADLDSFFAKKDKKKVKGKKFTTTDEIAKRLEDSEEKLLKTKPKSEPIKKQDDGASDGDKEDSSNESTIGKAESGTKKKEEE